MTPVDRLATDPRFSVWRIRNPLLRALAMWVSVLVALPLYLAWLVARALPVAVVAAVMVLVACAFEDATAHLRSLPWRQIGRALVGREVRW